MICNLLIYLSLFQRNFSDLQTKFRAHKYRNFSDLDKDIELLCRNAQTYNMEGSLVSSTLHYFI